jgi:hypothetical protein
MKKGCRNDFQHLLSGGGGPGLEPVDLQLVRLHQADLGQPVADVLPLVTLVLMLMTKLFSFVTDNELERLSLASLSSLA